MTVIVTEKKCPIGLYLGVIDAASGRKRKSEPRQSGVRARVG
jgi:hypothetical protein